MQSHLSKWEEQGQVTIFRAVSAIPPQPEHLLLFHCKSDTASASAPVAHPEPLLTNPDPNAIKQKVQARVMGVDLAVDVILDIKLLDGTDRAWVKSQVGRSKSHAARAARTAGPSPHRCRDLRPLAVAVSLYSVCS